MSMRTKSILLLAGALVVGILLGAFATSAWQTSRMAEVRQVREQGGVMRMLERTIEFESDEQRQEVEAILEEAEVSFRSLRRSYSDSMAAQRELLMGELEEALSPEQLETMRARMTRERRSSRDRGRRNGNSKHSRQHP